MNGDNVAVEKKLFSLSYEEVKLLVKVYQRYQFRQEIQKKYTDDELYFQMDKYNAEEKLSDEDKLIKKKLRLRMENSLESLKKEGGGVLLRVSSLQFWFVLKNYFILTLETFIY